MTDETPLPLEAPQKRTLRSRFRVLGMLSVIIAVLWVISTKIVPNPFEKASSKALEQNTQSTAPIAVEEKQNNSPSTIATDNVLDVDTPITTLSPETTESTIPPTSPSPASPTDSIRAESPPPTDAEKNASPQPLTEETVTSAPAEKEPAVAREGSDASDTQKAIEVPDMQNDDVMIRQLQKLTDSVSEKEMKISKLRCALDLQTYANHRELLNNALQQCYAILINAQITQGDIKKLDEAATRSGIPTEEEMAEAFRAGIIPSLRSSQQEHIEQTEWIASLKQYLSSVLTVRKKGWQEGATPEAIIGRAESYLKQSKTDEAFNEIQQLPEKAKQPFRDWLSMIEIRRAHQRAVNLLLRNTETNEMEQPNAH